MEGVEMGKRQGTETRKGVVFQLRREIDRLEVGYPCGAWDSLIENNGGGPCLITFRQELGREGRKKTGRQLLVWEADGASNKLWSIYRERGLLSSCWAQAPLLRLLLLIALRHVRSSWIRDQTHVSYTGKRFLYHWATREAQSWGYLKQPLLQHWTQVQKTLSKPDDGWCRKFLFEALGWIYLRHSHC